MNDSEQDLKTLSSSTLKFKHTIFAKVIVPMMLLLLIFILLISKFFHSGILNELETFLVRNVLYTDFLEIAKNKNDDFNRIKDLTQNTAKQFNRRLELFNDKSSAEINSQFEKYIQKQDDGSYRSTKNETKGRFQMACFHNNIKKLTQLEKFILADAFTYFEPYSDGISSIVFDCWFSSDHLFWGYGVSDWALSVPGNTVFSKYNWNFDADPTHNPKKEHIWTEVYFDSINDKWMTSSLMPIYKENEYLGTLGQDLILEDIIDFAQPPSKERLTTIFFIDNENNILAHPETLSILCLKVANDKKLNVKNLANKDLTKTLHSLTGKSGITFTKSGDKQIILYTTLDSIGWKLVSTIPKDKLCEIVMKANYLHALFMISIFTFIVILCSYTITRFISNPLKELSANMRNVNLKSLDTEQLETTNNQNWSGEIRMLNYSFQAMLASLVAQKTELNNATISLENEKELLSVTLRNIGDGLITTDSNGKIVLTNIVSEQLTGWKEQEAFNQELTEVFHIINKNTRAICENPAKRVLEDGKIIGLANHTVLISKNGEEFDIADSAAPIFDRLNNIIGVVIVFRDVTEEYQKDKEILKARKLSSLGILAGGIAHDFNNILTAILGNISFAKMSGELSHETKNILTQAEKASLRARDLTQQLLTFSKGGQPIKALSSIAEVIMDSTSFVLSGSNCLAKYDLPSNLRPVKIDKGQISQVIQNIAINAMQAMPNGGKLSISAENVDIETMSPEHLPKEGQYIQITMSDTGSGIPQNIIENIFDPYFSTKDSGHGLGLAVCHSIIAKHNGHISVKSNNGTTFTIYLPVSDREKTPISSTYEPKSNLKNLKVMIMDDDDIIRVVVESMISWLGHTSIMAVNGDEAIQLYKQAMESNEPIDVIIMDLTIRDGMGGKEAIQELIKIDPKVKAIVSTGYSNDPIVADYTKYGFVGTIVKPYVIDDLKDVLDNVM